MKYYIEKNWVITLGVLVFLIPFEAPAELAGITIYTNEFVVAIMSGLLGFYLFSEKSIAFLVHRGLVGKLQFFSFFSENFHQTSINNNWIY
jgi:hypothetical protein